MIDKAPGIVIETVGDDVLVLRVDQSDVLRLEGAAAIVARSVIQRRQPWPTDASLQDAALALVEAGVIVSTEQRMNRRKILVLGGTAAAVGITAFVLPQAAAAASGVQGGGGGSPTSSSSSAPADAGADAPLSTTDPALVQNTAAAGDGYVDLNITDNSNPA